MNDINEAFRDAAEVYAQRLREAREAKENPRKITKNNAGLFAQHLTDQLNEQRANGMRLDTNNL